LNHRANFILLVCEFLRYFTRSRRGGTDIPIDRRRAASDRHFVRIVALVGGTYFVGWDVDVGGGAVGGLEGAVGGGVGDVGGIGGAATESGVGDG